MGWAPLIRRCSLDLAWTGSVTVTQIHQLPWLPLFFLSAGAGLACGLGRWPWPGRLP